MAILVKNSVREMSIVVREALELLSLAQKGKLQVASHLPLAVRLHMMPSLVLRTIRLLITIAQSLIVKTY